MKNGLGQKHGEPTLKPSSTAPSKSLSTWSHVSTGVTHAPAAHTPGAPHTFPHTPQLNGSDWRSNPSSIAPSRSLSTVSHVSGSPVTTQVPASQVAEPGPWVEQTLLHAPQLNGSDCRS